MGPQKIISNSHEIQVQIISCNHPHRTMLEYHLNSIQLKSISIGSKKNKFQNVKKIYWYTQYVKHLLYYSGLDVLTHAACVLRRPLLPVKAHVRISTGDIVIYNMTSKLHWSPGYLVFLLLRPSIARTTMYILGCWWVEKDAITTLTRYVRPNSSEKPMQFTKLNIRICKHSFISSGNSYL